MADTSPVGTIACDRIVILPSLVLALKTWTIGIVPFDLVRPRYSLTRRARVWAPAVAPKRHRTRVFWRMATSESFSILTENTSCSASV